MSHRTFASFPKCYGHQIWQVIRLHWAENKKSISLTQLAASAKVRVPACLCFLLQLDAILDKHT